MFENFKGQTLTETVKSTLENQAKTLKTRILKPLSMVTNDLLNDRLNIELDENNKIKEVYLG